jgi:hypothetical protein
MSRLRTLPIPTIHTIGSPAAAPVHAARWATDTPIRCTIAIAQTLYRQSVVARFPRTTLTVYAIGR